MKKFVAILVMVCFFAFQSLGSAQKFSISAGIGYGYGIVASGNSFLNLGAWSGIGFGVIARAEILEITPGFSFGAMAHTNLAFGNSISISGGGNKNAVEFYLGALPTLGLSFDVFGFRQQLYFGLGLGLVTGFASTFGFEISIGSEIMFSPTLGFFTNATVNFAGGVGANTIWMIGATFKI
jgi:hypothetical protein